MVLRIEKKKMTSENSANFFIVGLLLLPIYIDLMGTLSKTIGFSTKITTFAYYGVMWLLLAMAIPHLIRIIKGKVVLGMLLVAAFVCMQYFVYPDNRTFLGLPAMMNIITFSPRTLPAVVPYILIGMAVSNAGDLLRFMHTGARVGIICGFLSYVVAVLSKQELNYDDMHNAYALCTMVCVLIVHHQKNDGWFIAIGCISLFLAGTRGPLVCVVVAVLIYYLWMEKSKSKRVFVAMLAVLTLVVLQSTLLIDLLDLISDGAAALGVERLRIIDYMRDGVLADSSGRDAIYESVKEAIWKKPFLGYGPGGDRYVVRGGSYAHNLALELWVSYGVLVGTAILGGMIFCLCKGAFGKDNNLRLIVVIFFCGIVLKLFLSSSYLQEKELFVLLGICIAERKNSNLKLPEKEEKNEKAA